MLQIIAQRGDQCLLTAEGYTNLMESARFLPVALAGWAPENEYVVGYIEGETVYRLVDETAWLAMLKEYRQRMLESVLDSLKQRGLLEHGPDTRDSDAAS
jgi:hypothetical protein